MDLQAPRLPNGDPFELAVVVSFGYFLPRRIIDTFTTAAVNVHPSLLPKYRGASPIQHAILGGDDVTGVSIIELSTDKFDAGRILKQVTVPVPNNVYYDDLHDSLANKGAELLVETLMDLDKHKRESTTQDESLVTHARRFEKSAGYISWKDQTKLQIFTLFRAIGSKVWDS
eukprot:jgi/Hompol1/130/HPOL_002932-RA